MSLEAKDGVEYAPGIFAAPDQQTMEVFLGCIDKYQKLKRARAAGQNK